MKSRVRDRRRAAGLCVACGARAIEDARIPPSRIRRLAAGHGSEEEYSHALRRPWRQGDPVPSRERMAYEALCATCHADRTPRRAPHRRRQVVRHDGSPLETARIRVRIGQLLREARQQVGLTQQALADRLGRPQSAVAKIEAGTRRVDVIDLVEIGYVARLDIADLVRQATTVWLAGRGASVRPGSV